PVVRSTPEAGVSRTQLLVPQNRIDPLRKRGHIARSSRGRNAVTESPRSHGHRPVGPSEAMRVSNLRSESRSPVVWLALWLIVVVLPVLNVAPAFAQTNVSNGLIAFQSVKTGWWNIFTVDPSTKHVVQLTHCGSGCGYGDIRPRWSPDGRKILFVADPDGS